MARLYVTRQGARVHLERGKVTVTLGDENLASVPKGCVKAILLFGRVSITSQLVQFCLRGDCDLAFFTQHGRYLGRTSSALGKNIPLRIAQVHASEDPAFRLRLAAAFVLTKIRNSHRFVHRYAWNYPDADVGDALDLLDKHKRAVLIAPDIETLRALEARAARIYFRALGKILAPVACFMGRSRRPPKGMANVLLSLGYSVVTSECAAAIEAVGLDPGIGLFHSLRYGRPSLALDLVEEFRTPVAERLAVKLLRNHTREFRDTGETEVTLTPEGFQRYFEFYEDLMSRPVLERGRRITIRQAIHRQAARLAACFRNRSAEYVPFLYK